MNIRATGKPYRDLKRLYEKSRVLDKALVSLTEDAKAEIPVVMVKDESGALVEWTRGYRNISSFVKRGYVRFIGRCPYQFGRCRGEKCQLYQIRNATGDCAHNWTAIGLWR